MMKTTTASSPAAQSALSRPERAQLLQLEDVIETARHWAVEEAKALLEIKEKQLWRDGHASFEDYGAARWGYEHSQLYRLTQWAQVVRAVSPFGEYPQRESHARPLYGLSAAEQQACWRAVSRSSKTPTASVVAEVVERTLRQPSPGRTLSVPPHAAGTVVVGDARQKLSELADGSVHLLLFSPPYAEQRVRDYPSVPDADYPRWMSGVLEAARPKLGPRASVMVVIREHVRNGVISDYLLRTRLAVRDEGWKEIDVLTWMKPDAPPTGRPDRPRRAYESVYWWSLTSTPFCDPKACGKPLVEPRHRMARHRTIKSGHHGNAPYMRFRGDQISRVTDVIEATIGTSTAGINHPAPFPLTLAEQLVRTYSPEGGLVADCCCGSGTTLLAARDAGRRYWGCDVVSAYVKLARQRLES
jgi:DNA modification methylase